MTDKDQDFCFSLMKTNRLVTRFLDRALKSIGITANQFYTLMILATGAKNIAGYARDLGMERSTASRSLAALEQFGLVVRKERYVLTQSGLESIEKCKPVIKSAIDRIVTNLSDGFRTCNNLTSDLKKVEEAVSPMAKRKTI